MQICHTNSTFLSILFKHSIYRITSSSFYSFFLSLKWSQTCSLNGFSFKVTPIPYPSLGPFLICTPTFLHVPPSMTRDFSLSSLKLIVFSSRKQQSRFLFISKPDRIPLGVPVKHRCFMFLKWALEAWVCFSDQGRV